MPSNMCSMLFAPFHIVRVIAMVTVAEVAARTLVANRSVEVLGGDATCFLCFFLRGGTERAGSCATFQDGGSAQGRAHLNGVPRLDPATSTALYTTGPTRHGGASKKQRPQEHHLKT